MNLYIKKQNIFWQKMLAGAGIVAALIIFLNLFNLQVRNSFYAVSSPFSSIFMGLASNTTNTVNSYLGTGNLKSQAIALQQENQNLLSQVTLLQDSLKTQQAESAALQNTKENNFSLLAAKPVGLDLAQDTVTINRGSADDVAQNMAVISSEKVVYGKVVKVYPNFSEVELISSKKSVADVKIQNIDLKAAPINGAIKGSGSLGVYLDLVSTDAKLNQNDVLVTSGLDGIFPRGLLVGRIDASTKNDAKPFQTANVTLFSDIKNAGNLFVIINYKK